MGSCIFACFRSPKCCSSSHISPTRRNPTQEAARCAVDEQQTIQMNSEPQDVVREEKTEDELVEKKVVFDVNVTSESDVQLDNLLSQKKKKKSEADEEEKQAHYTALSSTEQHPCSDDGNFVEDKNDFEMNVIEELESSESLFSLSIDSRKKRQRSVEMEEVTSGSSRTPFSFPAVSGFTTTNGSKSFSSSSSSFNSSEFNQSVLKPMENLVGWKTPVVTRADAATSPLKTIVNNKDEEEDKENTRNFEQQKILFREAAAAAAVDDITSLSSWLVNSNSSSIKSTEKKKKKNSSDDDITTGTVASYWLHIEQASATSDSGSSSKKQQQTDKEIECRGILL